MPPVPVLKTREVIRILERLGFREARHRGSHKRFLHPDGRSTTVPVHGNRDIAPALLRLIVREIGLTIEDFVAAGE
ncbi:MAG: type II toxin-antitoxin system HicA family toxin [Gemmatimonadota bacterium]